MPEITFDMTITGWLLCFVAALVTGLSKGGIKGTSMLAIPILAYLFGGKSSTGILLPMLIIADGFAIIYYHRSAQWKYIFKFIGWTALGIVGALYVGDHVTDTQFKYIIAAVLFICIAIMIWKESTGNQMSFNHWSFAAGMGILGGFATMIGNAAGPIFSTFLLTMNLPKKSFIGTGAWFFFIINVCKFPLHYFIWETIDMQSLIFDLYMVPFLFLGVYLGFKLVSKIPEKPYRKFIIIVVTLSTAMLFFK